MRNLIVCFTAIVLLLVPAPAPLQAQITADEYAARRMAIMQQLPDGIVLLHARSVPKEMEQPSFVQDPSFFYFTGLANQPGAILALDGPRRQAHLFVPPPPTSFGFPVEGLVLAATPESARAHNLDTVRPWDDFVSFVDDRIEDGVTLYVDAPRRPEASGVPPGMRAVAGPLTLWRISLAERFPQATIASARPAITAMRWVKSPGEVALMRRNARATVAALLSGIRAVRPGISQRQSEVAVVNGCIRAGAEGPSFWPWTMAGPNGHVDRLIRAFYQYHHLDRVMQAGELVRMDIGCAGGSYGADVGRTIPVSGFYDAGQRETWNLLIAAYQAGMNAMRAGVTRQQVMSASRARIAELQPSLGTEQGRAAGELLLSQAGMGVWSIHSVGIESGEAAMDTLMAGSVIAFEPMFEVGADAFYLEDMILITAEGHEVLSAGLPYTAEEIESVMAGRNPER